MTWAPHSRLAPLLHARFGGDEFIVILPEITEAGDTAVVAVKMLEELDRKDPLPTLLALEILLALGLSDGAAEKDERAPAVGSHGVQSNGCAAGKK